MHSADPSSSKPSTFSSLSVACPQDPPNGPPGLPATMPSLRVTLPRWQRTLSTLRLSRLGSPRQSERGLSGATSLRHEAPRPSLDRAVLGNPRRLHRSDMEYSGCPSSGAFAAMDDWGEVLPSVHDTEFTTKPCKDFMLLGVVGSPSVGCLIAVVMLKSPARKSGASRVRVTRASMRRAT